MGEQHGGGARKRRTAMALAVVLVLTGCSSEETVGPPVGDFAIQVVVLDADGQPVPDLMAGLAPALPESLAHVYPGWLEAGPDRALPDPDPDPDRTYQLTVRDVAGRTIWRRGVTQQPHWPLVDDQGRPVHDGWYELQTITTPLAGPAGADTTITPLIVYRGADPRIDLAGVTDAAGLITVTDRTYVPAFWDPEPVPRPSGDGDPITLTRQTWLRLQDEHGAEQWATFTAVDGPQTVAVTWEPFRVQLRVTDPAGAPVTGLHVVVMPALPDWYWPDQPARVNLTLRFSVPRESAVSLTVEDVRGRPVRSLVRGVMPAGSWTLVWDGRDNAGARVPPGWFRAVLEIRDPQDGQLVQSSRWPVLLATEDPAHAMATTDAAGEAVLTDRRLVPGFWDLDPIVVVDEEGDTTGELILTPATWIRLVDDVGREQWWTGELEDGPQEIAITWDP